MDMMSYLMGRNSGGGGKGAKIEVVTELPETGEANVIYLVPKETEDENNVFDEYLYINNEWELIGSTAIDISGKQDTMQFSTMPTASADYLGKIVQYTGTTNANYTNGYFYIGITDGAAVPTYSWSNIEVQAGVNIDNKLPTYTLDITSGAYVQTSNARQLTAEELNNVSEIFTDALQKGYEEFSLVLKYKEANNIKTEVLLTFAPYKNTQRLNKDGLTNAYFYLTSGIQNKTDFKNYQDFIEMTMRTLSIVLSRSGNVLVASSANFYAPEYRLVEQGVLGNYLSKANTSSYTPSKNYHPATKKYVDDSIAAAITTTLGGSY